MGRLTTVLATIATSLWATAVMAAYVPPPDQVPPRTRGGTAGRRTTCDVSAVTPLAPVNYLGKTTQSHPTFYWSKAGQGNVPLEFSLMEYLPHTQQLVVLHRTRLSSQGSIDRFQLPSDWQGLEVGKIYAWQVVALCGNPSANPYLRAAVQRVDSPPKNGLELAAKIKHLALQGVWYDALHLAMTSGNRQLGLALLQDLAQAEEKREPLDMAQEYRHSYLLQSVVP